ncbi:pantetheine-phosphate adenylyltransferase [Martelella lutilitoris]|uniref:Phosphopantetheine adenylyltransferase n=1 Tax=Martelella lutilitoris TaxID=2583532 RepID=A0A7T7KN27_9HYPH|nr:pantetheine-phosphate adenylyltransferase [Martelella lutilitoris]QQM32402.1 pantetheine-phosphate adenylyltransferase [Martelella lutilitoris]
MATAFYPGSFDPMTNGHLDVVLQALNIADRLVLGIGINAGKKPLFEFEERADFLRRAVAENLPQRANDLSVVAFQGLAIDAARKNGAGMIIRGLRDSTDFAYEMQMAGMNQTMAPDIQTVFLPAMALSRPISATLVRQVAAMGGDVERFVPDFVAAALRAKFQR